MKRQILAVIAAFVLLLGAVSPAYAETMTGAKGMKVTVTPQGEMVSNFKSSDVDVAEINIQPGDTVTFTVTLSNEYPEKLAWYMSNKVLKSLEEQSEYGAKGGAYEYELSYINPAGAETAIFNNDTVGGEEYKGGLVGLHGATSALEDFFFLDELEPGATAEVRLVVSLDGESQNNIYQLTIADLMVNFAAEIRDTTTTTRIVKTGDETQLMPLYIALGVSGAALLGVVIVDARRRKEEAE